MPRTRSFVHLTEEVDMHLVSATYTLCIWQTACIMVLINRRHEAPYFLLMIYVVLRIYIVGSCRLCSLVLLSYIHIRHYSSDPRGGQLHDGFVGVWRVPCCCCGGPMSNIIIIVCCYNHSTHHVPVKVNCRVFYSVNSVLFVQRRCVRRNGAH